MKSRLLNGLLFLISCLIAFGGIEVGLRIWGPDVLAMGNQFVVYEFDPLLGWDNRPNTQAQFSRAEFSYPVTINSQGMWDAEVKPKQPGEFRVAVLGDSFTWAIGAAYGTRFTEVVEAREPRINALNFGVAGFSPIQYLLQLDRILAFNPNYVVVAFCLGNDLTDNVSFSPYSHPKPYVALSADGETFVVQGYPLPDTKDTGQYLIGAMSASRIVGMIRFLHDRWQKPKDEGGASVRQNLVYVPPEKLDPEDAKTVRDVFKLNELIFAAMKKKIDAALGPDHFAVLLVPTKFEMGQYPFRPNSDRNYVGDQVSASLSRLGIPVVDGRTVIVESDFWKVDGHWRPSGHAKIGELLGTFLSRMMD
ncbi:MAG: hypothetical protein QOI12_4099 [Alphaproteobacteria bacterium]|jgi:hypothetical protein|nr:hypothetical protein [Alphaproteobacteria bacterium]